MGDSQCGAALSRIRSQGLGQRGRFFNQPGLAVAWLLSWNNAAHRTKTVLEHFNVELLESVDAIEEELLMAFFAARDAETSLACPRCEARLHIGRSCHEVHMHCPACKAQFPLNEYISRADEAMERFLENVYCDRI